MTYSKPEVNVVAVSVEAIKQTSKKGSNFDSSDGRNDLTANAYEADE